MNSIDDIKHVFYINLEHRNDRKDHIENQLKTIGINSFERFNAIKLTDGRVGCSVSHLKCLKLAKLRGFNHILICEDDTTFLNPQLFVHQLNKFLQTTKNWDVVLFAGNNVPPYHKVNDTCIRVSRCQTTTCYLVNAHYFDTLIQNIADSVSKLIREPNNHCNYAIDRYWFKLQEIHNWFLIIPLSVIQREDYSDIEKRNINYSGMMLDVNKEYLFK